MSSTYLDERGETSVAGWRTITATNTIAAAIVRHSKAALGSIKHLILHDGASSVHGQAIILAGARDPYPVTGPGHDGLACGFEF